ncbi:MAG TPA: DUF1186 domain-containing protein [Pirellulales bacterium]|nr:DUF1186 domain-containing protein [Pirellulales bacterium]
MSDVTHPLVEEASPEAIAAKIDRIMFELDAGSRRLPVDAIRAARLHRELMIPRLIAAIRDATARAREGNLPKGEAHFFALFLLIEFKAEEAFPAIVEAFSLPGEWSYDLFGEAIHSTWTIALALFAAERPEFIDGLISDRALNQYVRWNAAETYVLLVRDGRLTRAEAVERLRRLLRDATEQEDTEVAGGLVCVLLSFAPVEALDDLRQAFDLEVVDTYLVDWDSVERSIDKAADEMQRALDRCPPTEVDTIEELQHWAAFSEEPSKWPVPPPVHTVHISSPLEMSISSPPDATSFPAPLEPLASPVEPRGDRVGRNDPCPCGSGKKFKKCCGGRN